MSETQSSENVLRKSGYRLWTVLYYIIVTFTVVFLLAPLIIVVVLSFQDRSYGGWPPGSFTLRWYKAIPNELGYLGIGEAVMTSFRIALVVGILATFLGVITALALVRYEFRYSNAIQTLFLSPLIYPWVVVGLGILIVIGRLRTAYDINITLSFWTVVMGHVLITMPFPIRTVGSSLQNYDESLEEAAQDLGASEVETYLRITLPLIKPGLLSGFIFAFILSFNNYIVTLFLSGPDTETIPLLLFSLFRNLPPAQLSAIATLLMLGMLFLVWLAEYFVGISKFL